MVRLKNIQSSTFLTLRFAKPIFDWRDIHPRFFEMLYDALSPTMSIAPSEFSTVPANSLGDLIAKYSIFGGNSTISLAADRLVIEFPGLVPAEYEFAFNIVRQVDDAFPSCFPECNVNRIQVQNYEHGEMPQDIAVDDYLVRYFEPLTPDPSVAHSVLYKPIGRFSAHAKDGSWWAQCGVEESAVAGNALYIQIDISLLKLEEIKSFDEKVALTREATSVCLAGLDLEWDNGA